MLLIFVDKWSALHKVYVITKDHKAQGVKVVPLTRIVNPPPVSPTMLVTLGDSPVTHEPGQAFSGDGVMTDEDKTRFPSTNTERDNDQDQSPLKGEDSVKWTRLSKGVALGSTTSFLKLSTILPDWIPCTP